MKPDYSDLDNLTAEEAFKTPMLLMAAIEKACPESEYIDNTGFEYGTALGPRVTEKLATVVKYAQTQPLKAYADFETKLETERMSLMRRYIEDNSMLMKSLESETTPEEALELILGGMEAAKQSDVKVRQAHMADLLTRMLSGCRHILCRLNRPLRDAVESIAEQSEENSMTVEPEFLPVSDYNPIAEKASEQLEEGLAAIFEASGIAEGNFQFPGEYHHVVVSDDFLPLVQSLKIFPGSDQVVAEDLDIHKSAFSGGSGPGIQPG